MALIIEMASKLSICAKDQVKVGLLWGAIILSGQVTIITDRPVS